MSKLVLKSDEMLQSYFDCDDTLQVINRIKLQMEEQRRVIYSIRINDNEIAESNEKQLIDYKLANVRMIEVEYCEYDEFYEKFVTSTKKFINDIKQICPHLSEAIFENKISEFHKLFHDFVDSMESLMAAVHFIHYKGKISIAESKWKEVEDKTSAILSQVLQLYPNKDFVSLADVFDYEMTDVLEDWLRLLQNIKGNEQRDSGKGN